MSRNRLAEIQTPQNAGGATYGGNSETERGNDLVAGESYELQQRTGGPLTQNQFLDDIDDSKEALARLDRLITRIEQLHSDSFGVTEDQSHGELDSLVASTSSLINSVKANLDRLATDAKTSRDQQKLNLINSQRKRFQERVQRYQNAEKAYRDKLKDRTIRQYQIVYKDASDEEISAALDDPNTQIFQQALLSSSRSSQAQTTLREVQSRHNDIVAIERKVTELAQLFNELAIVIEAQEQHIEPIVQKADETQLHMKDAEAQVSRAVVLARAVRRKKWWCVFIIFLIIAIVVLVAVLVKKLG